MAITFYAVLRGETEINLSEPEHLSYAQAYLKEVHHNERGEPDGVVLECDLGHGYCFDDGTKTVTLLFGQETRFTHSYTDTSDGTWDDGSFSVRIKVVETEEKTEFYVGPIIPEHWL